MNKQQKEQYLREYALLKAQEPEQLHEERV